jgi:molecular chaperone GrpE
MTKEKKQKKDEQIAKELEDLQQHVGELTLDLKRTRADFENYRKRTETEKDMSREAGRRSAVLKLLPVVDNIERAINHVPEDLRGNKWVEGIASLTKNLDKSLENLGVKRIEAAPGTHFNPDLHEAILMEDGDGDLEVIAEELQAGYTLDNVVVRHSLVKVTKK